MVFGFFFCKQKTAYEMRISDWSSDVCSSDLWFISDWTARPNGSNRARDGVPMIGAAVTRRTSSIRRGADSDSSHASLPGCGGRPSGKDRKSVVWGKSVSVRVDRGGGCIIKKKKSHRT